MAESIVIMIAAVVVAVLFMMVFEGPISQIYRATPDDQDARLELLAADRSDTDADGLDRHIPKGYIYFAMAVSVFVEMLNLRMRCAHATPVKLHDRYIGEPPGVF